MPILNVPYVTQNNNNIYNDCGFACVSMLIQYLTGSTVAIRQLIDELGISITLMALGKMTSAKELQLSAAMHGIPLDGKTDTLPNLTPYLADGKPVICLVDYSKVPDYARTTNYKGNHWVVLTGIDDKMHYNDPLVRADLTVEKWEWSNFYLRVALVPQVGHVPKQQPVYDSPVIQPIYEEIEMDNEHAEALQKATIMQNLILMAANGVRFVKPNPDEAACYLEKDGIKILVPDGKLVDAGLNWGVLNR